MRKIISYSLRLTILILILFCSKSTTNAFEAKVENNNINKTINLNTMAIKVIEANTLAKFTAKDTFTGGLPNYNIKDGTTTYNDEDYGQVFIVASSKNLPCGSILRFKSNRIIEGQDVLAIVLDRGVGGSSLDLLTPSEEYASKYIGRSSITYDVLRSGWNRD